MNIEDELSIRMKQLPVQDLTANTRYELVQRLKSTSTHRGALRRIWKRWTVTGAAVLLLTSLSVWGAFRYWSSDAVHYGVRVDTSAAGLTDGVDAHFWVMNEKPKVFGSNPNDHLAQGMLCVPSIPTGAWIVATSTIPTVTTGFTQAWSDRDTGLTVEQGIENDAINTYLQAQGLSKTQMALHAGNASSREPVQITMKSSRTIPDSAWRLVVMDVGNIGTTSKPTYVVHSAKILQPGDHDTLDDAVLAMIGHDERNVSKLWSAESGGYAFAMYDYVERNGTHLVNLAAERDAGGGWKITHSDSSMGFLPQELTQYTIFNAESGSALPDLKGSYMIFAGLVNDARIVRVRLDYIDGNQEIVPVIHHVFGAVQTFPGSEGRGIRRMEGLDASGRVVYP